MEVAWMWSYVEVACICILNCNYFDEHCVCFRLVHLDLKGAAPRIEYLQVVSSLALWVLGLILFHF